MRVADLTWMQLGEYLARDDRIVLPLGSTEQHAYLSLATDSILAGRLAEEAAEPLGVPVLPVLAYGLAPAFAAYPGSPSLSAGTYGAVVTELVGSLHGQGFRRILVVNGHGGNRPAAPAAAAWAAAKADAELIWHDWWMSPRVREAIDAVDPAASHASWMESFPWTRVAGVTPPDAHKPRIDEAAVREADPDRVRELAGDGSYGGFYERPDADVLPVWQAGVEETRELLERGWRR
jgi:creatinine amidohydrolase